MNTLKNKVQLIGHLGADPKVTELNDGKKLAKFTLATTDFHTDKSGNKVKETYWHNLVVWGGLVKVVEQYLTKGKEIAVEGKLTNRMYEDKEGNKRYFTEIIVNNLLMLGKE